MFVKPSQAVTTVFTTTNLSTGAAANADSTPTGKVYRNGVFDASVTVTVANLTTGVYEALFNVGSGYAAGDMLSLIITATMSATSTVIPAGSWQVDTKRFSDTIDANLVQVNGVTAPDDGTGSVFVKPVDGSFTELAFDPSAVALLQNGLATASALSTVAGYVDTEIGTLLSRIPQALTFTSGRVQVSVADFAGYGVAGNGALNLAEFFNNGGNISGLTLTDLAGIQSDAAAIKVQTDKFSFGLGGEVNAGMLTVAGATLSATAGNNFSTVFHNSNISTVLELEDISAFTSNYTTQLAQDLQALVDAGRGANVVTVTVRDGSAVPLQSAMVRLSEGANSFTALTNASGVATFALDNHTYTRSVTKAGYIVAPDTMVVTGAGNSNVTMSSTASVAPPSDPSMCRVYGYLVKPNGELASNVVVTFKLQVDGPATAGSVIATRQVTATTNNEGLLEVDLIRNDVITPDGSYYTVTCKEVKFPTPQRLDLDSATFNLSDLV